MLIDETLIHRILHIFIYFFIKTNLIIKILRRIRWISNILHNLLSLNSFQDCMSEKYMSQNNHTIYKQNLMRFVSS